MSKENGDVTASGSVAISSLSQAVSNPLGIEKNCRIVLFSEGEGLELSACKILS